MKKLTLLIASIAAMSAGSALAKGGGSGVQLGLDLYYNSSNETQSGAVSSTSKSTKTYADIELGYQMPNGLYLGGIYTSDSLDNGGGVFVSTITAYGATVGFHAANGWFINGSYLLSAEYGKYSTATDKWNKGSGIQVDGGYMIPLSGNFMLGTQLSYRSYTFTNYNNGTVDSTANKLVRTEILPEISLTFVF